MEIQPDALRKDIIAQIRMIDEQIGVIEEFAKERNIKPVKVTDQHGAWVLPPLLLAKVISYNSLVALQAPRESGRTRGGPPGRTR
jgi:hypothetical protein